MGKQNKKNSLFDASGKKILHPAEADRKKFKLKAKENRAKNRKKNYESKMLQMEPDQIEAEISEFKEMEQKGKLTKWKKDKMTREITFYNRLKDQVDENDRKRIEAQQGDQFHVDFDELKLHRKSSIFYDPVKNPYGAPPQGQVLMYRHPDGSVKKEPPELPRGAGTVTRGLVPGHGDMVLPGQGPMEEDEDDESGESEDEDEEDDEPMLPSELPDGTVLPPEPAPLPPGPPVMPPLPPGPPPLNSLPPMPPGPPPGCGGLGRAPPSMPKLPSFPSGPPQSQADFAKHMMSLGYQGKPPPPLPTSQVVAGPAPKRPPNEEVQFLPEREAPGPPPKAFQKAPAKAQELPVDVKPPPPPPKKAAGVPNAATRFMPTTLRTKKPSQVAGGVIQASAASLSQASRNKTLLREAPKVGEKSMDLEDAFKDFMHQLDT